ncbi:hypothetical protein V6N13_134582 [Hibiscus sabdariffa]
MADALVSALVSTILNNLNSLFLEEVGLAGSLKTDLESLQRTFTTIQAVLHDAEQKQWKSDAIKIWLRNLQQAAYDLEDVLDDFQSQARGSGSKVSTLFSLQNPLLFRSIMARRVKAAREKLDAIAEERIKFHLEVGVEEAEIERNDERETSSLVNESEVIGRADEKGEIVSMILSNATHHDGLSVYAICGMGGLGKTTIAQLVYNDQNVAKAFDLTVWVCVSDDFDVKRLTKAIVESIEEKSCNIQDLDPLQRRLVKQLVGKRFLIVLDDVWNESRDKWDRLTQALQSGGRGSAVIVTTRHEKVAHMMATVPFHRLGYHVMEKDELIGLWMSNGFIPCRGQLDLHDMGSEIFSELTRRVSNPSNFISNQKHLKVLDCGDRFINVAFKSLKHLSCHQQDGNDEEILDALQPHPSLKKLCITYYQGVRFPNWMMDLLLPNLVEIELVDCGRSDQLPPLGKLRFLKVLNIRGMDGLKCIDSSFYGDMESSFPSLEVLTIERAGCLEEWTTMNGGEHFPLLSSLTISGCCSKLVKLPMLQSLKELVVSGVNVTLLKSLMMNATDLTSLRLSGYGEPIMDLPAGLLRNHKQLETLRIDGFSLNSSSDLLDNLSSLKRLELWDCSELESLPKGIQNLRCLESLSLDRCGSLVSLAVNGLQGLSSLSSLYIADCRKLSSLTESIQHLSSLRRLRIRHCERLSGLPNEIQHLTSLSQLSIEFCPNMLSLPQGVRSLTALQTLNIVGCPHLERRCKKEGGEDWPIIAHIPNIQIPSFSEFNGRHADWTCSLSGMKARFCP